MFYITHRNGQTVATLAPEGEIMSPRYTSDDFADAAAFDTFGAASDAAQNFSDEWDVEELA